MTSSEERQKIAEKMRGPFDVCKYMGHTCISGTLFGMQVCAMNERSLRDSMRRLADLIDPTCHLVSTTFHSWSDGSAAFYHELSCGHICETVWGKPPSYCSECGARLVDEDGY